MVVWQRHWHGSKKGGINGAQNKALESEKTLYMIIGMFL